MAEKLTYNNRLNLRLEEERYENIKTLFTISFVFTDSLMIFDLVANAVKKEIDEYFFIRFFMTLFGLYGTLILIGGYYLIEYCGCECDCNCGKCFKSISSIFGCHLFISGLLLIISYCLEIYSIKFYFYHKDKITDTLVISMLYGLFILSTTTIVLLIILIINMKNEKRVKQKID